MNTKRTTLLLYAATITTLGAAVVARSAYRVIHDGVSYQWLILAYLTVLTGAFTVRIPRVNSKFSASDAFIFINTILFGVAAGVLTAVLDGLHGSVRCRTTTRRKQMILFNTAVLGISVYCAGELFFRMLGQSPLSQRPSVSLLQLALPALSSALVYYLCNSILVAGMLSLDGGGNALRQWRQGLSTTLPITLAGVAAGTLLAFGARSITPLTLLAVVPILVAIYFVNTIYLQPEADTAPTAEGGWQPVTLRPAYRRFHYFMVALGLGFVALLLQNVISDKISYQWLILASLAVVAGFITVKIPGIRIKFSLADIFVFANTILFGPVVGGITAALDGLAGSMRCKTKARRMEFTLFNVAGMALSAYIAGELFFRTLVNGPVFGNRMPKLEAAFLPALVLAISYYLLNTMGVAVIVALQMKEKVLPLWRENLLWGLTTSVACALGAVFLSAGMMAMTPRIALAVLLMLAVIYVTFNESVKRVPQRVQSA